MIHRIRFYYSAAGAPAFHVWLQAWKQNLDGDTRDAVANNIPSDTVSPLNADIEYYAVSLTFDFNEDRGVVFTKPYQKLKEHCDWCRIAYHECEHDEQTASDCSWESVNEHGDIPDAVPTFR
jgi:hypothetical protein